MKKLIFIFIFPIALYGQILTKKDIAPLLLTFSAGVFEGTAEALKFHYPAVDSKLSLNDNFWNPSISWRNKYKNNDPLQGNAFIGSTTFLVWTTDGYHLTRMMRNICIMTCISIKIGERQRWYEYIFEAIIAYISYQLGFTVSYDIIFNKSK